MKKSWPLIFYLVISLLLILIWFRDGRIFAGGDVGFQTFNPRRIFENARFVWWNSTAPGAPLPQNLSAIPLQFILLLLQLVGFSSLYLQATLFFVLLFLMGFGMYLFLAQRFENDKKIYSFIGGIFYMFNPFMMIQVWHRFIHTTIILAAVLPFFAIFWDKWIKEGSVKNLLFFLLINILAVYIYGTYAYIVTVWIFLLLLTITDLVPWQNRRNLFQITARFLFGFVIWILINCWWLMPVAKISPAILSEVHKSEDSIVTLISISRYAVLPYTLQLVNPFYVFEHAEFGVSYKSPLLQIMPWIFVLVILAGLISSFKNRSFSFYGILFLISIFLTKGAAPPFGSIYIFGFKNIFALGVLRDPFEKTGLILVFFATVMFVLGIEAVLEKIKGGINGLGGRLLVVLIIASVLIFSWPMLLGKVFGSIDKPGDVEVPQSYKIADEWLIKQKTSGILDGNIIHLPLTRGEAVNYNWRFGYNGLESSDQFFTAFPSVSRGFNIQRVDDSLTALSLIFYKPFGKDHNKILQLLQAFNIRFIVLHKDINWLGSDIYDPLEAEKVLNSLDFIEKKAEFGQLVIYQILDNFFGSKIEIHDDISLVYPQNINMKVWPWLINQSGGGLISPIRSQDLRDNLRPLIKESVIFPQKSFSYPEASRSSLEIISSQINYDLYNLNLKVQNLKHAKSIQNDTEETVKKIISLSSKLIDIYHTIQSPVIISSFIDEYSNLIADILPQLKENSSLYVDIDKTSIIDIFKLQKVILSYIPDKLADIDKKKISESEEKINQFLNEENLLPIFPGSYHPATIGQRQFLDFWINTAGEYELLLTNSNIKETFADNLNSVNFIVNGQPKTLRGNTFDNVISFGKIDLKQGLNEVSFSDLPLANLFPSFDNLTKIGNTQLDENTIQMIASGNTFSAIESPLAVVTGNDTYQISFNALLQPNVVLSLQIIQDMDPIERGEKVPRIGFPIARGQFNTDWQEYNFRIPALSLTTREARIRLIATLAANTQTYTASSVSIRNLRLVRIPDNEFFLKSENISRNDNVENSGQIIKFTRISPVQYEGVVNLVRPSVVFFKETYHDGWKLQLTKGDEVFEPHDHYLGYLYSNAWYVDKIGEYKFKITFEPQNLFFKGILLAGLGLLCIVIYLIIIKRFKQNGRKLR